MPPSWCSGAGRRWSSRSRGSDIIRTIIVEPTVASVGVLGAIVVIRILLSFSLDVEIDGVWPWARWRLTHVEPKEPQID